MSFAQFLNWINIKLTELNTDTIVMLELLYKII